MDIVRGRIFYSNEMTGAVLVIYVNRHRSNIQGRKKKIYIWYIGIKEILHRTKYNIYIVTKNVSVNHLN